MDEPRSTRGYALSGLVCVGALACGPSGSANETETTGYPMTGTEGESGTNSGTRTGTATETSASETGTETATDTADPNDCSYRGDICGEYSVCQCSCDYTSECCGCEPAACTEDSHCPEGDICLTWVADHYTNSGCYPAICSTPRYINLQGDADPSEFADTVCAWNLILSATPMTDLSAFPSLEHVIGYVDISYNPALTSLDGPSIKTMGSLRLSYNDSLTDISALTSLEAVEGGFIYCNGALQDADIAATLAQIPGGDVIEYANNGAGPCP